MTELVVALYQNNSVPLNPAAQVDALGQAARNAAEAGAQLLITPELFMTGYYIPGKVSQMAESADGPFIEAVSSIANDAGLAILVGYPELSNSGVFNSAALIANDGELLINHRKLHLSGAYEKSEFILDANKVQVAEIAGVKVAPMICYDVEFPEAVRSAALKGAELVAVPTALIDQYYFLTRTLIPTRAFENGLYVAYVNHAGSEGNLKYCGLSTLAGPLGQFEQTAGSAEELLVGTINTAVIADARQRLPYHADMRLDLV